jgi:hypothetical protein
VVVRESSGPAEDYLKDRAPDVYDRDRYAEQLLSRHPVADASLAFSTGPSPHYMPIFRIPLP